MTNDDTNDIPSADEVSIPSSVDPDAPPVGGEPDHTANDEIRELIREWKKDANQLIHEGTDDGVHNSYVEGRGAQRARDAYVLEKLIDDAGLAADLESADDWFKCSGCGDWKYSAESLEINEGTIWRGGEYIDIEAGRYCFGCAPFAEEVPEDDE